MKTPKRSEADVVKPASRVDTHSGHRTKEDLAAIIKKMKALSHNFYLQAVSVGHHAFIEFTGFMNEYIKMCERASEAGRDFVETNAHCGETLIDMEDYEGRYLGNKFGCIFATSFRGNPAAIQAFCDEVFGQGRVEVQGLARPSPPSSEGPLA